MGFFLLIFYWLCFETAVVNIEKFDASSEKFDASSKNLDASFEKLGRSSEKLDASFEKLDESFIKKVDFFKIRAFALKKHKHCRAKMIIIFEYI